MSGEGRSTQKDYTRNTFLYASRIREIVPARHRDAIRGHGTASGILGTPKRRNPGIDLGLRFLLPTDPYHQNGPNRSRKHGCYEGTQDTLVPKNVVHP